MNKNPANGIRHGDKAMYPIEEKQFQMKLHEDPEIEFLASAY